MRREQFLELCKIWADTKDDEQRAPVPKLPVSNRIEKMLKEDNSVLFNEFREGQIEV